MTNRTHAGFPVVLIAVLVATTMGCGHQTSPTAPNPLPSAPSSPPRLPGPEPTATVPAGNNGQVGVYRSEIIIPLSGTATVTLTWPDADFSLQLYVTSGACADATSLLTGECTILGSTRPGLLPGVVTSPVTGGDRYTIWVLNPDPAPQGFNVAVNIE